jgi:RNA polymerase sigma-70 factor (ECF subfamily)
VTIARQQKNRSADRTVLAAAGTHGPERLVHDDETRLVLRAQAGDQRALDALLRRHEQGLLRHVHRMLRDEEAAYDALQETYLVVCRCLANLRERSSFRPWLYGVATRICLKVRSRSARRREDADDGVDAVDGDPLPDVVAAVRERKEGLVSEVERLSPKVRSVVLLHFYEGMTLAECAAALEISTGTVKSRLAAGLARLRERLEEGA